jgi:hypothetical protein
MSMITPFIPDSTGDKVIVGGAAAGGAAFAILKGGPSAVRHGFVKQIDQHNAAFKANMLDYFDRKIKPYDVLSRAQEGAESLQHVVRVANQGHAPSVLRIATYGLIGAVAVGAATAGVINLVQKFD